MKKSTSLKLKNRVLLFFILLINSVSFACTTPLNFSFLSRPSCDAAPRLASSESGVSYQLLRNGVNHGAPKIGTGTIIDFGTQNAGTYSVVATRGTCSLTMSSVVTVSTTHDGNPSEFGDHIWNVYGFVNSSIFNDTLIYSGYYTQKLSANEGFDTGDITAGGWGGGCILLVHQLHGKVVLFWLMILLLYIRRKAFHVGDIHLRWMNGMIKQKFM